MRLVLLLVLTLGLAAPDFAANILLVNDGGLTANTRALYRAVVAAGHEVIVSAPRQNQSGKGASLNFLTPLVPLTKACVGDAASAMLRRWARRAPGRSRAWMMSTMWTARR